MAAAIAQASGQVVTYCLEKREIPAIPEFNEICLGN